MKYTHKLYHRLLGRRSVGDEVSDADAKILANQLSKYTDAEPAKEKKTKKKPAKKSDE